jgi:2'-phosphotransferase
MLERLIKPLDICVHGTDPSAYELIKKTSLKPMSRCHIHLASGLPNDSDIVSGMRPECKVHIYIDMLKAMRVGKRFYCSSNGVILTPDSLEPELFKRVDIL